MTRTFAVCFLLIFCLRPASAAPPLNGVYLGKSQILETAAPRQISLNAHVTTWQTDPLGLTIAYIGSTFEDGTLKQTIKLAGVKRGQMTTLYSTSLNIDAAMARMTELVRQEAIAQKISPQQLANDEAEAQADLAQHPEMREWQARAMAEKLSLEGWSADGRYLLAKIDSTVKLEITSPEIGSPFVCIDTAANPPRIRRIVPPDFEPGERPMMTQAYWSPGRTRIAFERMAITEKAFVSRFALYDPASDKTYPVKVGANLTMTGDWLDENHWLMGNMTTKPSPPRWFSLDVTTGKEIALTTRPKLAAHEEKTPAPTGLTLADEPHRVADKAGTATMDAHALWIRRQNGPKMLSAFPVALTPGADSPQAGWLPGGKRVAFVSHGDLFVADLVVRPAIPREKLAAGETLSCPEERDLAVGNLKLIGLAITQYMQDNDENYPPGAGVEKTIDPYIKDPSIFAVGASRFVYKPPANRSLAAMAAPAATVIGTLDLRCATISLYADGHVRAKDKPGFE